MDISLNAKLYAGYGEQIEMIKQKQKQIGGEILAELEKAETKKINITELGTFSITEKRSWDYDKWVRIAKAHYESEKKSFEGRCDPSKITKYLRFQRTALDKNEKNVEI